MAGLEARYDLKASASYFVSMLDLHDLQRFVVWLRLGSAKADS